MPHSLPFQWPPTISSSRHAIIYAIISLALTNYAASDFSRDIFEIQFIPLLGTLQTPKQKKIRSQKINLCECSLHALATNGYTSVYTGLSPTRHGIP